MVKKQLKISKKGRLLVLTGTSGAGKDTVMQHLIRRMKGLKQVVTYASRAPREGEVHGVHYNFVSEKEFLVMVERDEFIEHVYYGKSYKGTHKSSILSVLEGESLIWRIDMSRAAVVHDTLREKFPEEIAKRIIERTSVLLLDVPSHVGKRRAKRRDKENFDEDEFERRSSLDMEVKKKNNFQHVVHNKEKSLRETVDMIEKIILRASN